MLEARSALSFESASCIVSSGVADRRCLGGVGGGLRASLELSLLLSTEPFCEGLASDMMRKSTVS